MGRAKIEHKRKRLNLSLPLSSYVVMEKLKAQTEATSLTEVICRALVLYKTVADSQKSGHPIMVKNGDREEQLLVVGVNQKRT